MYLILAVGLLHPSFSYDGNSEQLPKYVADVTTLKTCNIKLIEQIIEYIKERYADDTKLQEQVLRSISSGCISKDDLIAVALGLGIDPGVIMVALDVASSTGSKTPVNIAPSPGDVGSGGGTGSGDSSLTSGN